MARIRTIKPEFWDSPDTARASAVARLAYIAMWNWADDQGRGTANLKELEGFIFPNDDVEELSGGKCRKFRDVVAEVSECFGVVFYTVRGRPFYAIPAWDKHQRNERKAGSKYPGPDEADSPVLQGSEAESRNFRDSAAEAPQSSGPGTGEQGNRGTGEQSSSSSSAAASDGSPYTDEFLEWWKHYPRKQDKGGAFKAWKKIRHATLDELIAGADRYANDPNRTDQYTKHAATWLNNRSWEDEDGLPARIPQSWNHGNDQRMDDGLAMVMRAREQEQKGISA